MTVDKGRFTQRIELFESQRNDVQSYFDKGIQELKERSVKGAKLLEEQQKKEEEFVAEAYKEAYESYITPYEMVKLGVGDFFFFHNFFMKNVGGFMETFNWRYGQCFFNLLMDHNARVGEMLRGSIRDPYHKDEVSEELWDFLMDNWEEK
jgi:hypothetical protein